MIRLLWGSVLLLLPFHFTLSQIQSFPYSERFDSVQVPLLPSGWLTSAARSSAGDFFSTTTSPRSAPIALQSTNSVIPQFLVSPRVDFTNRVPGELRFSLARSGTHTSPVIVEASPDNGATWPFMLGDTLRNPGSTGYVQIVLTIPDTLTQKPEVRFRWRVLGGIGGTAGTLRLDDISVTVLISLDLSVAPMVFLPLLPDASHHLTISTVVSARGVLPHHEFSVGFFMDQDKNGAADANERFYLTTATLSPGESLAVTTGHPPLSPGFHRFLAVVHLDGDENPANDTSRGIVHVGIPPGSVAINEIQYAPEGDEPEWVEVVNLTGAHIDLQGWRIADNRTGSDAGISNATWVLPPAMFGVVARDSSILQIHDLSGIPWLTAPLPSLNNTTPDAVVIRDDRGVTIDSVSYSPAWGVAGRSLERIDVFSSSLDRANWAATTDSLRGTPGRMNTNAIADLDVRLASSQALGSSIVLEVVNTGRRAVTDFSASLRTSTGELIGEPGFTGTLPRGGTAYLSHVWAAAPPGTTTLFARIELEGDGKPDDNIDTLELTRAFPPGSLIINEIMYEPLPDQNEWIELFNPGSVAVHPAEWTISDAPTPSGTTTIFLLPSSLPPVSPGGFLVIAAESTILELFPSLSDHAGLHIVNRSGGFGFSNDGDGIVVRDLTGATMDSVWYTPAWHHPLVDDTRGRSLERIRPDLGTNDPRNWSTTAELTGGSPGNRNTIHVSLTPATSTLSISPNPFSPDGDGFEDFCIITYSLPLPSAVVRLSIFDAAGRLIRTLADAEPAGSSGALVWDGFTSARRKARIGPYIILLEAAGVNGEIVTAKSIAVVATKL